MSGDGGSSGGDGGGKGGFGGVADSISETLSELSDRAGQMGREIAGREQAAASMGKAGVSNMSGMDTFSPETGKSTGSAATASANSRGTSGNTSGFGIGSVGRDTAGSGVSVGAGPSVNDRVSGAFDVFGSAGKTPAGRVSDAFSAFSPAAVSRSGFGIDLGAALNPEPIASQGNLMEAFSPVAASNMPGVTSPERMSTVKDTLTYTAPSNSRSVETLTAHASPTGHNAKATERAGQFGAGSLSPGQREYDLSTKAGRAAMTYGKFRDAGYTHAQAAGVLGNMVQESNLDPAAIGDYGNAYGMYQHNDRAPALMEFAAKRGKDWTDPETQVDFALHELETTEARAARSLAAAQTPREAAIAFSRGFERPKEEAANNGRRASEAEAFAEQFADWEPTQNPNTFSGELDVAMAPAGVELDDIDMPGSRATASAQASATVGTPDTKPGSTTHTAAFDNGVGPLAERDFAHVMPSTTADLMSALGAPAPAAAPNSSLGRLETTYLDPDVRTVQTTTISATPATTTSAPGSTVSTNAAPAATASTATPEKAPAKTGMNNTAKTVISTGIDVAAGIAAPPVGIYNAAATAVNAGANLLGFDNVNMPTVGSMVVDGLGNIDFSAGSGSAPAPTETDPTELAEIESAAAAEPAREAASAAINDDPVVRLETRYFSPYPTPAERWGPNARQYRGA